MQQHAIPQNVTNFEFKIVGFLTLKQFAMIGTCSVIAFICYFIIENFVAKIAFIIFFVGLGILLTFGSVQQIPFYRWIIIFVKAIFSPTQRVWIKAAEPPQYFSTTYAKDIKPIDKRVFEDRSKLSSYLQTLPATSKNQLDMVEHQRIQSLGLLNHQSGIKNQPQVYTPPQLSQLPPMQSVIKSSDQSIVMPAHDAQHTPPQVTLSQQKVQPTMPAIPIQTPSFPQNPPTQTVPKVNNVTPAPPQSNQTPTPPPTPMAASLPPLPTNNPKSQAPKQENKPITLPTQTQNVPVPPQVFTNASITMNIPKQQVQPQQNLSRTTPAPLSRTSQNQEQQNDAQKIPTQPSTSTPPPSAPTQNPQPKFWSTIQKMEREYLEELKRLQQDEQKEKENLKSNLLKDFENTKAELIKQKEAELKEKEEQLKNEKQTEIQKLEQQLQEQKDILGKLQSDFTTKEQTAVKDLQEKLAAERTKREEFEKASNELNDKITKLAEEKQKTEEELKVKANQQEQESAEKLKNQLEETNKKMEALKQEAVQKAEAEKQRQSTEAQNLKEEVERQKTILIQEKKALEDERLRLEAEHQSLLDKIQKEKDNLIKKNQELIEEKSRLEKINSELLEKQKQLQNQIAKPVEAPANIPLPAIPTQQDKVDLTTETDLDKLAAQLHSEVSQIDKSDKRTKPSNTHQVKPLTALPEIPKPTPPPKLSEQKTITDLTTANIPPITNLINVINGVVYDKAGNFVPNVIIIVKDSDKSPVRALKTNRLGQFAISTPLPNGTYTMEFEDSKEEKAFDIYQITLTGSVVAPVEVKEKE
jgi:hypothetical protein